MFIYTLLGIFIFLCVVSVVVNSGIYQRLTLTCYHHNLDLIIQWTENGSPLMTEDGILGYGDMRKKFTQDFQKGKLSKEQYSRLGSLSKDCFNLSHGVYN